jgi:prohibitin 1
MSPPKLGTRQAAIIRAEGEAEAAARISKSVADYGTALIEIRRIDVSGLKRRW